MKADKASAFDGRKGERQILHYLPMLIDCAKWKLRAAAAWVRAKPRGITGCSAGRHGGALRARRRSQAGRNALDRLHILCDDNRQRACGRVRGAICRVSDPERAAGR
jgi:hypothetical protein